MLNKISLTLILCFLSFSCSMTKKNKNELRYSNDVENSLSTIEGQEEDPFIKRRREAIERYKRLREEKVKKRRESYKPIRIVYKQKRRPRKPVKPKKRIIHADPEVLGIEIEQKLTYFCMKHRKSRRFNDDGSCQEFTENNLDTCREKFDHDDRNLLYCVERSIR